MHDQRAEDATYENEIAQSRPKTRRTAGKVHVNALGVDPFSAASQIHVVLGPPHAPNEIGIWPPMRMLDTPAYCAYVDAVRRGLRGAQLDPYRRR
jgi:hypothetical protein